MCDHSVFKTNYRDIFLTAESVDTKIITRLPMSKVNLINWVSSRDDFLSSLLDQGRDKDRERTQQILCRHSPIMFNDQPLLTDDPGVFIYLLGESMVKFACSSVVVQNRQHSEFCYKDLPVTKAGEDMFLQARTRILSKHGKPTICQSQLPYLFLSLSQHWVAMSPRIHSVPTPSDPLTPWNTTVTHEDMSQDAGLYSQAQVRQKLDTLEFESFHATTTTTLAATICKYGQHGSCPSHPQPTYMEFLNPPQMIHKILEGRTRCRQLLRTRKLRRRGCS